MRPKVFCIGFPKTGTSSLAAALYLLGYCVAGPPRGVEQISSREEAIDMISDTLDAKDAFQDSPYPYLYRYIDKKEIDSKYILTVRDEDEWFESTLNHFGGNSTPLREWIYGQGRGNPDGNRNTYINVFKEHTEEVEEYFDEDELLVIDFSRGDGWKEICQFLDLPVPPLVKFPHVNNRKGKDFRLKGVPNLPKLKGVYSYLVKKYYKNIVD